MSLNVVSGESVAIVSPSGSGKSTLLRLLLGLEEPTGGEALLHLPPAGVGAVFQEDNLLPWLGVIENGCLLSRPHRAPVDEGRRERLLESCGLAEFRSYYPSELSAGMR